MLLIKKLNQNVRSGFLLMQSFCVFIYVLHVCLLFRLMIDELAADKAYLAMNCQESHNALQQMLNERHELRRNLFETYK